MTCLTVQKFGRLMKAIKYFNLLFCIISLTPDAQANLTKLSLQEYLLEVEANSLSIQSTLLRSEALKHRIGPSSSLDDPFFAFGLDEIPFEGEKSKVKRYQLSQSIPFPGKLNLKEKIAESRYAASTASVETIKRQIRVIATQLFLKAQYNEQSILSYEQIKTIIESITTSVKAKYRTGENNHHEWIQVKLELSTLNVELLRLQRLQLNLKASLNELRNKAPETPIEFLPENFQLLDKEQTEKENEIAIEKQPEVQSINAQLKSSDHELTLAKLSFAPDFVLQGMAMEPASMDPASMEKSNWGFMVGINIPLYFWSKQSEQVAAAEKDRLASIAELNILKNRIETEYVSAKAQLETSLDVLKLYKNDVLPLSEIAVKNAKAAYAANRMTLRQLLESLQAERVQKLEYLGAQMDVVVSRMRMKDILSNPPLTRFAPARPFRFDASMGNSMGETEGMDTSGTINPGTGINLPKKSGDSDGNASPSGMGDM